MKSHVLLIEDDIATADFIAAALKEQGYAAEHADNGRDGLRKASGGKYDCIIIDRTIPEIDGMKVLSELRGTRNRTPIILLSALGAPEDRIEGLLGGADDYLGKPFVLGELMARVYALVRRQKEVGGPQTVLQFADLEMDLIIRQVRRAGRVIDLQPREFLLLEYLLRHAGQIVTRSMLLQGVWDCSFDPGTNVIDVHLSRLRKKVDDRSPAKLLNTIRGVGYMLGGVS
jgi:two-component system OmpR family response regulator